jgi:hypothetical protein
LKAENGGEVLKKRGSHGFPQLPPRSADSRHFFDFLLLVLGLNFVFVVFLVVLLELLRQSAISFVAALV